MLKETLNKGISTPIAIGIILIIAVIVGGFTYLEVNKGKIHFPETKIPERKCSRENPNLCNRNCNSDEDCQFTCAGDCGPINKKETCHYKVIPWSCAIESVKCENNICVVENVIDKTANWETYANEKYGFEVKYPEDWKITVNAIGDIYFRKLNCGLAIVQCSENYVDDRVGECELILEYGEGPCSIHEKIINNIPFTIVSFTKRSTDYFFQKEDSHFKIILSDANDYLKQGESFPENYLDCQNYFDHMLPTFKFLD